MEKLKNKLDRNLLANYIVNSYNQGRKNKAMGMEIDSTEITEIGNQSPELELEFDSIVNNNEYFNYEMYLD